MAASYASCLRTGPIALVVAASCLLLGCADSALAGLAGQWEGTLSCGGQSSDVRISIETIDGATLSGTAVVRTGDVDKNLKLSGSQREETRKLACLDDRCGATADCVARGGGRCNAAGLCEACLEDRLVTLVTLTLSDENVSLADPRLELVRLGDTTLDGPVLWFCSGARDGAGTAVLRKR
jgi:hypothetical protein